MIFQEDGAALMVEESDYDAGQILNNAEIDAEGTIWEHMARITIDNAREYLRTGRISGQRGMCSILDGRDLNVLAVIVNDETRMQATVTIEKRGFHVTLRDIDADQVVTTYPYSLAGAEQKAIAKAEEVLGSTTLD